MRFEVTHNLCALRMLEYTSLCLIIINSRQLYTKKKYVEIKCQLDATEVFVADLIAC